MDHKPNNIRNSDSVPDKEPAYQFCCFGETCLDTISDTGASCTIALINVTLSHSLEESYYSKIKNHLCVELQQCCNLAVSDLLALRWLRSPLQGHLAYVYTSRT